MAEKPKVNNLLDPETEFPTDLLTDEQAKAFFDAHKASRTTMVLNEQDQPVVISKSAKSIYNSWLWQKVGEAQSRAKRLHALEIKKHEDAVSVPVTGHVRQSVKARGKAKQTDDAALHAAMLEAVLEELREKGVDLSVLDQA